MMPMRSLARVIGVCATALLLTGCKETVEQVVTIHPDRTSDVSITIAVDDEGWEAAPSAARTGDRLGSDSAAAHLRAEVKRDGGSISPVDGPDHHGVVIKTSALTEEQVQALLLAVWSSVSGDPARGQPGAQAASYRVLSEAPTERGIPGRLELMVPSPPAGAPVVVTTRVTVPGRVTSSTREVGPDGRTVSWQGAGPTSVAFFVPTPPSPVQQAAPWAAGTAGMLAVAMVLMAVRRRASRCPSCHALTRQAKFCRRCGAALPGPA